MCTLAIYFRTFESYPVVVAANRDEYLARAAMPPVTLNEEPHVVGGKDLRAGGTWLGINEHGLIAGLLNRRTADYGPADPNLRSRGLLCLEALRQPSAAAAARFVEHERGADYNAFNLLIASREAAFVAYNRGGEVEVVELVFRTSSADQSRCQRFRVPAYQPCLWPFRRTRAQRSLR